MENYLDNADPEDEITSANFPEDEDDVQMLLNGIYAKWLDGNDPLRGGLLNFGLLDGATPNGFNWGASYIIQQIGDGTYSKATEWLFPIRRWTRCYSIIYSANYLLSVIDDVEMDDDVKARIKGEAHFNRGVAYSLLVDTYGGVPVFVDKYTAEDTRTVSRATAEETWAQVIADYDVAIENLDVDAEKEGQATRGAALGMKMRAYLYQGDWENVIEVADEIDALGKYSLFSSYAGLFTLANENNEEVLWDIQYMRGEYDQGTYLDQYCGTGTGSATRGSRYVPTEDLVNAYERIDGSEGKYFESEIDLDNPYDGWDPRMETTVVVPGAYILGYRFPNYLYSGGAYNHSGCMLRHLATRKYRIEPMDDLPVAGQSDLNYMVVRYADVILSRAEAMIELGEDINGAIALINRIRTERDDVTLTEISTGLSQDEAREKLRHERRIEFAMEGLYWSDIRRWDICDELYPLKIYTHEGSLIHTKFADGYLDKFQLLPIPISEIALNENLTQNEGW